MTDGAKKPKRRRLRRFVKWSAIAFVALLVVGRIALWLALPSIVAAVGRSYDLRVEYERLGLSILTGDVELWHLDVADIPTDERVASLEYLRVDVSIHRLLFGEIVVRRVEVDGLDVWVERHDDGSLTLDAIAERFAGPPPETPEPVEPAADVPLDATLPIRLDALRLQHIHVNVVDRGRTPPFEGRFDLDVRVSNIGHPTRRGRFEVLAAAPTILDAMRFEGELDVHGKRIDVDASWRLDGFHPQRVRPYLEAIGIRPRRDEVDISCAIEIDTRGAFGFVDAVSGRLRVTDFVASVDGEAFKSWREFVIPIAAFGRFPILDDGDPGGYFFGLDDVGVVGYRAKFGRNDTGDLVFGGHHLVQTLERESAAAARGERAPTPAPGAPGAATPDPEAAPPAPTRLRGYVRGVGLRDVVFDYRDESGRQPIVGSLRIPRLGVTEILLDPARPEAAAKIVGLVESEGFFRALEIDGTIVPFAPMKTASIDVQVQGIGLQALRPVLASIGVEITDPDAGFTCHVDAEATPDANGVTAAAHVRELAWRAEGKTVGIESAGVTDLRAERDRIIVSKVNAHGYGLAIEREPDGALRLPGLRLRPPPPPVATVEGPGVARATTDEKPPATETATPATPPEPTSPDRPPETMRIEVGEVALEGDRIRFVDRAIEPVATIELRDARLDVTDAVAELRDGLPRNAKATVAMSAKLPGVIESMQLDGTIDGTPGIADFSFRGTAGGITLAAVAPYLARAGVESTFTRGEAGFTTSGRVALDGDRLDATLRLNEVALRDADTRHAALERADVELQLGPDGLLVRRVELTSPSIAVARTADGAFAACGLRTVAEAAPPTTTAPGAPTPAAAAAPATADPASPPTPVRVERIAVRDATLTWRDATTETPLELVATATVAAQSVVIGADGPPTRVEVDGRIEGVVDSATLSVACTDLDDPLRDTTASFDVAGLRAGPLATYLPDGIESALTGATLRGKAAVRARPHPEGGRRIGATVTDVHFAEPSVDVPWLAMRSAVVDVSRYDPAGGVVTVERIAVDGFTIDVLTDLDGSTKAFGLAIPAPSEPVADAPAPEPAPGTDAIDRPKPRDAVALARRSREVPSIVIDAVDLGIARARYRDRRRPTAPPLEILELKLVNSEPLRIDDDNAETLSPWRLAVTGAIAPLVKAIDVRIDVSPFAPTPHAKMDAVVRGIDARPILDAFPDLRERIRVDELHDGLMTFKGDALLSMRRRDPLHFPFDRPFGASIEMRDFAFRPITDGDVALGLDAMRADIRRIDPSGAVSVKSLAFENPVARVTNTDEGLRALGLVLLKKKPAPTDPVAPADAPPTAPSAPPQNAPPAAPSTAPPSDPGPEIRIDRLTVTDVDLVVRDETYDPPLLLPLDQLDVDIRGLSSHVLHEPRRVRFDVHVGTGDVPVNPPADETVELRPFVEDLAIRGDMQLVPNLRGRVRYRMSALELRALRGVAAASGVTISNGILDAKAQADFIEGNRLRLQTKSVFTDLSMSEPANGPISRILKLPAPLDAVIYTLRDRTGAITIPMNLTAEGQQIGTGQVVGKAVTVLGELIARALLNSPFRILGGVTDLTGLTGNEQEGPPASTITFQPGATTLTPAMRADVDRIADQMRDPSVSVRLEHVFGRDDIALAATRANPPVEDCLALIQKLRDRKRRLLVDRATASARATAVRRAQIDDAKRAAEYAVTAIDRELGQIERSLDELGEHVRVGAERYASRRTRAAALELATRRLEALRDALIGRGVTGAEDRVRIARPRYPKEQPAERASRIQAVPKIVKI